MITLPLSLPDEFGLPLDALSMALSFVLSESSKFSPTEAPANGKAKSCEDVLLLPVATGLDNEPDVRAPPMIEKPLPGTPFIKLEARVEDLGVVLVDEEGDLIFHEPCRWVGGSGNAL